VTRRLQLLLGMSVRDKQSKQGARDKVRDHAWKGTWERPVEVDEDSFDPLTVARMTDHNVRGSDREKREVDADVDDGGKVSPEEAIRIQSKDLP